MSSNKRKALNEKEYCVYRYVENGSGRVLYVGKTNSSLRARVCAHRYEEQFQVQKPFHIEYIVLDNKVETDSVEKFFINKWKPPLNVKDNVAGLADVISSEMENIEWRSYECYENERRSPLVIKKHVDLANMNALFLLYASTADSSNKFAFPYLISDTSFLQDEISDKPLLCKEIVPGSGGYIYTLQSTQAKEYVVNHCSQIETSIWEPVLNVCKMTDDEELRYSVFLRQFEFCEEIDVFAKDGYENDSSIYRYNFRTEYPGADVYYPFTALFDGSPYISLDRRTISGDISTFAYEQEMPRIREQIGEDFLNFIYQLKTPVVSKELVVARRRLNEMVFEPA